MNKSTLFLFISWFLLVGCTSERSRSVASKKINCLESFSKIVKPKIMGTLSKASSSSRLKYLLSVSKLKTNTIKTDYKLARLINDSKEQGHLTSENVIDLYRIIKKNNNSKMIITDDHKLVATALDESASAKQIESVLRNYPANLEKNKLLNMNLSKVELGYLKQGKYSLNESLNLISFSRTYKPHRRQKVLSNLFRKNSSNKFKKKFQSIEKKVSKYEDSLGNSSQVGKSSQVKNYRSLLYACRAREFNAQKMAANKSFARAVMASEVSITGASYLALHHDEEKNKSWYSKLGFELLTNVTVALVRSGITINPNDKGFGKILKDYLFLMFADIGPSTAYGKVFGVSENEIEEAINKIINSKDFQRDVLSILEIIKREDFNLQNSEAEFRLISSSDIENNEEVRDTFAKALAVQLYEQRMGKWIQTGDVGLDRFTFHRLWTLQASARNIAVSMLVYHILCTKQLNPKEAYAWAIATYVANKTIFEPTYFFLRKEAINQ